MNVLILNWRDPQNPKSGGAEKLNMHILKPLIDRGDSVVWYALNSEGLGSTNIFNGVRIIRKGNILTHFMLFPILLWKGEFGKVDLVIDCIHGTGYLSNYFAPRTKKIIFICEVAKNIWDEMYPFPINILGKIWEKVMFRLYKGLKFWTISQSTKNDLIKYGVSRGDIKIIPMGFDGLVIKSLPRKYKTPVALFVGRIAKMKGIEDAIRAISMLNAESDVWTLHIIGRGDKEYEKVIKRMISKLKLQKSIKILGYVSEREKFIRMAKSWALLVPSVREGWGMIVPEANSVGTKVIGYKVPGLVDSLMRYKGNSIVNPNPISLMDELSDITRAQVLLKRPTVGWDELYKFVKKEIA